MSNLEVRDPRLAAIVGDDVTFEKIAGGCLFTEGPLWHPQGRYLLWSDMPGDHLRRWSASDGVTTFRKPCAKSNGLTWDRRGRLLACEHATSRVTVTMADGSTQPIATHWNGKELNSPNDIVVHSSGAIYFSDPSYGRWPGFGIEREQDLDFQGVYRLPAGGGDPALLVDDFGEPNGLCFSPDESLLYINDTPNAFIRVFDVQGDGTIATGRLFAKEIGDGDIAKGELVDGMKCDERGNIWVTGPGGVWVFAPDGEHLGVVEIPESVGNIHWGGSGWNWMFVPASTSLYRFKTRVSGRREPFMTA